ncbi:MAG: STAS domain-containing protein [Myxococcales bacterium]|nr:STAS domain-containing protein [Myxococcales bacterium]
MPVEVSFDEQKNEVTVVVTGRFDFTCHNDFRRAFALGFAGAKYRVDLGQASYMDSAALGMLLLLRDKAEGDPARVEVANSRGQPRDVLQIANFGQLLRLT